MKTGSNCLNFRHPSKPTTGVSGNRRFSQLSRAWKIGVRFASKIDKRSTEATIQGDKVKRYQLTFGLFLVSSLGFAAPGDPAPFGGGAAGNPFQQRQQADAQAGLIGAQAQQAAATEVARLERDKVAAAARQKELAAQNVKIEKERKAIVRGVRMIPTKLGNDLLDAADANNPVKMQEARAANGLRKATLDTLKDADAKLLADESPQAVRAFSEKFNTELGNQIDKLTQLRADADTIANTPGNQKPLAEIFKTGFLEKKDVEKLENAGGLKLDPETEKRFAIANTLPQFVIGAGDGEKPNISEEKPTDVVPTHTNTEATNTAEDKND